MTTRIKIHDTVFGQLSISVGSILKVEENRTGWPTGAKSMITCEPKNEDGIEVYYHTTESVAEIEAMIDRVKEGSYADATH